MKKFMSYLESFEKLLIYASGVSLFGMMLITVISVLGRYFFRTDAIPGAYNIVERILFPLLVFWALPLAYKEGTFPKLEFILDRTGSQRIKKNVKYLTIGVELAIYCLVLYFVFRYTVTGIQNNQLMQIGTKRLSLYPILIMVPISFALLVMEAVINIYRNYIEPNFQQVADKDVLEFDGVVIERKSIQGTTECNVKL